MLKYLRRGLKSWVAKALMGLLVASFAVWGIGDVFSTRLDTPVATVGEQAVTVDAFANALQRARNQLIQQAQQPVSYAEMQALGFDRQVLRGLMRDAAFREELSRLGLSAPDAAVAQAIRTNPAFQSGTSGFSDPSYRLAVSRLGFTPAQFEALTRTLLGQQILAEPASTVPQAVPGAAARIASYQAERRAVATVTLPLSLVEDPGVPDGEVLLDYYAANAGLYVAPERRTGQVLAVDIARLAEDVMPEEADVLALYDANADRFTAPATRTIDLLPLPADRSAELAQRVLSGEQGFEALAEELGEPLADLDLGTVRREDLPEATAETVFAATEPGVIGPVRAPVGSVLIRVRAVSEGSTVPLDDVRDLLAAQVAQQEALALAPDLANRIEDLRAAGKTLSEISQETGLPLLPFAGLSQGGQLADGGQVEGFLAQEAVRNEIFAALDHEERPILETERGGYFLVYVDSIQPSAQEPLSTIRERVITDWQRAQRLTAVTALARRYASEIAGEATLAALAEAQGWSVVQHDAFARAEAPRSLPETLIPALFAAAEGDAAHAPAADAQGVVLAEVTEIARPDPMQMAEMSSRAEAELMRLMAEDGRELFARAILASHPAEVDEGAIEAAFSLLGAARQGGQ